MSTSNGSISVTPTPADAHQAAASYEALAGFQAMDVRIASEEGEQVVSIPASAVPLIRNLLQEMGKGKTVSCMASETELTTQQAADLLSVSRPFLIERLDSGEIPCRKVGSHRRVQFSDVIAYKRRMDELRLQALQELTAQAQDLDMGY